MSFWPKKVYIGRFITRVMIFLNANGVKIYKVEEMDKREDLLEDQCNRDYNMNYQDLYIVASASTDATTGECDVRSTSPANPGLLMQVLRIKSLYMRVQNVCQKLPYL